MSIMESILVAIFMLVVVFFVLVVLFLIIKIFSFVLSRLEVQKEAQPENVHAIPRDIPVSEALEEDFSAGSLKLVDVDEPTAAMIMAIVSDESGIPLSELCFKSICLKQGNTTANQEGK